MTTFSVITPVYNAERFVERGMSCLFKQTFSDFEIIAVNDGSTDQSGDILNDMARKDVRLKVIHKQNEGVGWARNEGLRHAQGEYVFFMDIDDLLDQSFFLEVSNLISRFHNPDLLMFGFNVSENGNMEIVHILEKYVESKNDFASICTSFFFQVRHGNGFLWNKIYRRAIIEEHSIRFNSFRVQEDELFNIEYMKFVDTAYLYDKAFYTYFINNPGNSRARYLSNMLDIMGTVHNSFTGLRDALGISDSEYMRCVNRRFFHAVMQWCRTQAFHPENKLSSRKKKEQLQLLNNSPMWKQAYMSSREDRMPVEHTLYAHAIKIGSAWQLFVFVQWYTLLRSVLNKFRHASS